MRDVSVALSIEQATALAGNLAGWTDAGGQSGGVGTCAFSTENSRMTCSATKDPSMGGSPVTFTERRDEPRVQFQNDSKYRESSATRRQDRPQHDCAARGIPCTLCGMLTRDHHVACASSSFRLNEVCAHIQPDFILRFFVAASTKSVWNDSNSDSKFGAVVAASPFP